MDIEPQVTPKRQRSLLRTAVGSSLAVSAIVFGAAAYVASDLKSVHGEVSARSLSEFVSDYMFVREGRRMKAIKNRKRAGEVVRRTKAARPGQEAKDDEELKLVWQMAYPFAGSAVALNIVQDFTGKSMATNYGDVLDSNSGWKEKIFDSEPIRKDMIHGPFKYRIDKDLPDPGSNILVKTHCAGHCMDIVDDTCTLRDTVGPAGNVAEFFEGCAKGTAFKRPNVLTVEYNRWAVEKVLLLARHPVEIIVARFINVLEGYPSDSVLPYQMNNIGIGKWCKVFNNLPGSRNLKNWYTDAGKHLVETSGIPCHGELFRIAKFYSQSLKVIDVLDEPNHIVHFDDYDKDLGNTIQGVMNFLDYRALENMKQMPFNRTGDNDVQYFDPHHVHKMLTFFNIHVTEAGKDLFKDYV